jgi:hypothetical protein
VTAATTARRLRDDVAEPALERVHELAEALEPAAEFAAEKAKEALAAAPARLRRWGPRIGLVGGGAVVGFLLGRRVGRRSRGMTSINDIAPDPYDVEVSSDLGVMDGQTEILLPDTEQVLPRG